MFDARTVYGAKFFGQLGKALAIQGSSATESSGALRQLSQAFSSGIVRAEEFNSILEGAFPIAQAAANAFGTAALVVLYFDIRCRKEAFDLEHLARQVESDAGVLPGGIA